LTACRQNLRDGVAMDVDEEEEEGDSTQRLRKVADYGIEVDFGILSANEREVRAFGGACSYTTVPFSYGMASASTQNSSGEVLGDFDASIAKLNAEIERMTPNMKAMDRHVFSVIFLRRADGSLLRLDDVESKLVETEKEAEKARKDSKNARDTFSDVKQRRYGLVSSQTNSEVKRFPRSTELFNKAYNHISERIDQVYKDLTKGKAAPMGGVAYLSLEDNEVRTERC
jgi:structural maintenance of chromosome 1